MPVSSCICACTTPHNIENSVDDQKSETKDTIEEKENDIEDKIDDYADALDKKIEKMKILLKTMRNTEALMKANQVTRRNILKIWHNIVQVPTLK